MKVELLNLNGGLFQVMCVDDSTVEITEVVGFGKEDITYTTQDEMIVKLFKHVSAGFESKQKEICELENSSDKLGDDNDGSMLW